MVETAGKKLSPPFSSPHPPCELCCSPTFSQVLSWLYFRVVKEATCSLGFTCLWGKGRAALRGESFSVLPALCLALQTMAEGFCSLNLTAFLCLCLSWHLSFEMENMVSGFCPVSWVLIQLLQGTQGFCGQFLFYSSPDPLCCCAWINNFCRVGSAAKVRRLMSFLSISLRFTLTLN